MAFTAGSCLEMGLENQMPELSTTFLEDQLLNSHNSFAIPHTNSYSQQSTGFPGKLEDTLSSSLEPFDPVGQYSVQPDGEVQGNKNTKSMDISQRSSRSYATLVSQSLSKNKNNCRKRKRVKINEKEDEKSKEVVNVRARRGQATDKHSLAERLRRQKINQKLKCLEEIIPGCYKAKGLASMLDEIINYVQCLHNQIEFLSMKLTAASTLYDFNSETNLMDIMQRKSKRNRRQAGKGNS